MKYYSTNHQAPDADLRDAIIKGLAPDKGLYMPERLPQLPADFFERMDRLSFQEIAGEVAVNLLGEDVPEATLRNIVADALNFDIPVVPVADRIHAMELFHGPTLAFKDVGARFMARLLRHFIGEDEGEQKTINVLVATSGDTGSAVANGFLGVEGIHVYVLYPNGKVSPLQEMQFTTLGRNITAIAVDGTFDDCQALVKSAFMDDELQRGMKLTSANSINLGRLIPQSFYYFYAYAQMKRMTDQLVICVPSGNFGNLAAGLMAWKMGLPIRRFIAAKNRNDVFYQYLQTGGYHPRPSIATIANAMDVGAPSNFARIQALFDGDINQIRALISGATYSDDEICQTIRKVYETNRYLLDPHGACAYLALEEQLMDGEHGVFLETAHPAKFNDTIARVIGRQPIIPDRLQAFMNGMKQTVQMENDFSTFKSFLLNRR